VSILANYVANAVGPGFTVPTGRADFQCDIAGRREDTTPLVSDPYTPPTPPDPADYEYDLPDNVDWSTPGSPGPNTDNPDDPVDTPTPQIGGIPTGRPLLPGDELTLDAGCPNAYTEWWLCQMAPQGTVFDPDSSCKKVGEGIAAVLAITNVLLDEYPGWGIYAVGRCPDPSSPTGYGEPRFSTADVSLPEAFAQKTGTLGTYRLSAIEKYRFGLPDPGLYPLSGTTVNCTTGAYGPWSWNEIYPTRTNIVSVTAYGLRAWAATATITATCDTSASPTLIPILTYQTLNSSGVWSSPIVYDSSLSGSYYEGYIPTPATYFKGYMNLTIA